MLALLALVAASPLQAAPTAVSYPGSVVYPAFGQSVALEGDSLVVGAPEAKPCCDLRGEAFIFTRSGAGWDHALTLSSPNTSLMGWRTAVGGDVAAVSSAPANGTKVLVAERTGGNWALAQTVLYPGQAVVNARFADSLAIVDDRLIVSASGGRQGTGAATGVVYVYGKVGGAWAVTQSVLPPLNANGQTPTGTQFGRRVAVDGDLLVASAPLVSRGSGPPQGALHIYRWDPAALPSPRYVFEATLDAPASTDQNRFGWEGLDVSSGRVAVGSIFANYQGLQQPGMLHLFEDSGGGWQETARFEDPLPSSRGYFGWSVALSDDRVLVGRLGWNRTLIDDLPVTVEVFEENAGTWAHAGSIPDPIPGGWTRFGEALDVQGDELAAGFAGAHVQREDRGACYVGDVAFGWDPIASLVCGGSGCACPGRSYEGCGNSGQISATISAFGSTSVTADDLQLTATGMRSGALARLLLGRTTTTPSVLGDGVICVGRPGMLMPVIVDTTGAAGFGEGLVARAAQQLGSAGLLLPGESWIFQAMYSESRKRFGCSTNDNPSAPGYLNGRPYLVSRGFNLTNAITVTFTP